jgi:hypothetical protein
MMRLSLFGIGIDQRRALAEFLNEVCDIRLHIAASAADPFRHCRLDNSQVKQRAEWILQSRSAGKEGSMVPSIQFEPRAYRNV